jgi:tRNA pseudouridine55 synthase
VTGVLLVDKPEGISSAGVIRALKPRLGGAKVGHVGTLDPFASGLLPLCIGQATKVARFLLLERKAYTGTIRLGIETDTLDRTGNTIRTAAVRPVSPGDLDRVSAEFVGARVQTPPMYSALKRDGVPLYALARQGVEVDRAARPIELFSLSLRLIDPERVYVEVDCSKGTYIRVLAAEIGAALGTVAHLEALRRTAVGHFGIDAATPLAQLVDSSTTSVLPLLPIQVALSGLPGVRLPQPAVALLRQGQQGPLNDLPMPAATGGALVLDESGEVVCLLEATPGSGWRLARLFVGS